MSFNKNFSQSPCSPCSPCPNSFDDTHYMVKECVKGNVDFPSSNPTFEQEVALLSAFRSLERSMGPKSHPQRKAMKADRRAVTSLIANREHSGNLSFEEKAKLCRMLTNMENAIGGRWAPKSQHLPAYFNQGPLFSPQSSKCPMSKNGGSPLAYQPRLGGGKLTKLTNLSCELINEIENLTQFYGHLANNTVHHAIDNFKEHHRNLMNVIVQTHRRNKCPINDDYDSITGRYHTSGEDHENLHKFGYARPSIFEDDFKDELMPNDGNYGANKSNKGKTNKLRDFFQKKESKQYYL